MHDQMKDREDHLEKQREAFDKIHREASLIEEERKRVFGGQDVQNVQRQMEAAVQKREEEAAVCKTDLEKLSKEITIAETEQKQKEKDSETLRNDIFQIKTAIDKWISDHSPEIDFKELQDLLQFTLEWRENEQAAIRKIEEAKKQAVAVLQERLHIVEKHQLKRKHEATGEQLQELQGRLNSEIQKEAGRINEISFTISRNEEDLKKVEALLQEIQKKQAYAEDWARLNEVIGSADGKKFRQIAQEYTLEILLEYANVELSALTKRYSLQRIPNTLGLQVVDHDMGDEMRTVFSLSGGESFLLSLALALGLSSLSSSEMKVESLFIDEGFGALDPQTLNIAMDALERLHDQGRKVGVISHVQEMTERIPVQIKVEKNSGGRSVARVVGQH